ncbi:hypothetical protein ACIA8O_27370 [Kitasatospora sp. NPDC051853]|uniref:hypothetical protein n=1 Tax=Kitasatospora sp. NPDC051853 TaxID=3364058 RepID=UPI0037AEBE76
MLEAYSEARLAPYLLAGGSPTRAAALYVWNIEVSAAFVGPLNCLETTLRNSVHRELTAKYSGPHWWRRAPLNPQSTQKITEAEQKLTRRGRPTPGPDSVVAELSFGFWVSLLSRAYDRHLWVPALHRAFPHFSGRRHDLHDALTSLLLFRNRIMHHEPIHHRALADDHAKLYRVLGYLSPGAADGIKGFDRVPAVLRHRDDTLSGRRQPRF